MKRKLLHLLQVCAVLLLCTVLCAGCGKDDGPALGDYFTEDRINAWKEECKDKELKYTMHGGYFLHYQGQNYPIEFQDGVIHWQTTPPTELLLIRMNELFTDASLKKRCAYLGRTEHAVLFQPDCHHSGYLLDGKRPDYGSVLYVDETDLRQVFISYGDTPVVGVDDEIKLYRYNGDRAEEVFTCGNVVLSDANGVFLEERNTFRKIFNESILQNIPFDAYTEYTNLAYPSSIFRVYDDIWWQEEQSCGIDMNITSVNFAREYHIRLCYKDEKYQDVNCMVFADTEAIQAFYADVQWALENPGEGSYRDVVLDEQGIITQCYYKYFYGSSGGKDNGAQVHKIFYSLEEFNQFLAEQTVMDPEKHASLFFSRQENGEVFDGFLDYRVNSFPSAYFQLYGVWKEYHTVNLHTPDETTESIVCNKQDVVLPVAMRPGYAFEGWYADESYSGQPVTHVSYTDGYTDLYAKFREADAYRLTFEAFDGKTLADISYTYGEEIALPYVSKPFYVFKGWCVDPECKTTPVKTISTAFYGSFHLYPCFEPQEYTLTLIAGDRMLQMKVCYGEQYYLLTHITKEDFIGYFDENGVQYTDENGKSLAPFTDGADIQLFAKYKEEST